MSSKVKKVLAVLIAIQALVIISFIVFEISVSQYRVMPAVESNSDTVEEPERDIIDQNLYNVDEITEDLLGHKVAVVGFMCNEVGTTTSAAWIHREPFREKDTVVGELRIDTGGIIQYTPLPVEIIGRVVKDEQADGDALPVKIDEAEIYIYGGSDPEYKRIKDILEADLIAHIVVAIDEIESNGVANIDREQLEADYKVCATLAEESLRDVVSEILEYTGTDEQDRLDFANTLKIELAQAIYKTEDSES